MQGNEICRGARHRVLILMYISWLTLSLAPTIVAPPEKSFARGQPEMQLAMDNMVSHGTIIKKRINSSSNDGQNYHAALTSKTSNLLEEAEHVLSSLPESKDRQWIEAFVHRMRAIATILERTAENKKQNIPKYLNSVSGTPVPERLPLQPTWPATSAVPGINPYQKPNRMVSKFPVTSPELSQVLPENMYHSERQAVTKPAVLSNKMGEDEDDELVRELESLPQKFAHQIPQKNYKVLDQVPTFTTPSTPVSHVSVVSDKITLHPHLAGATPNEAEYSENETIQDISHNQEKDIEDKLKKFTEVGMVDGRAVHKLNNFHTEDKEILDTKLQNLNFLKKKPYHRETELPRNFSQSLQNIHPNFHPNLQILPKGMANNFHYVGLQNKILPYQGGLQNAVHDLRKPNPYHIHGQYHAFFPPTKQQPGHIPDALKQMLSKPQNKIYNEHLAASNYNAYLLKHGYSPYPYMHNWDHNNSSHHLTQMMPPYQANESGSHQIDTQLSDEMKRQLRDGKIIVLSDSVVRSNFEPNNEENSSESKPNELTTENVVNKNDTIAEK